MGKQKKKPFSRIAVLVIVLFVLDRGFYVWANKIILSRDADFDENYVSEAIDWSGLSVQNCRFNRVLLFYTYQTCFDVRAAGDNNENWYAVYYYHRALPKFSLLRIAPTANYYFSELALGKVLFVAHFNGQIIKGN